MGFDCRQKKKKKKTRILVYICSVSNISNLKRFFYISRLRGGVLFIWPCWYEIDIRLYNVYTKRSETIYTIVTELIERVPQLIEGVCLRVVHLTAKRTT